MSHSLIEPIWNDLIDPKWIDELDETTFLTRCREGIVTIAELNRFMVQHYHYSRHFTRYLCALIANLSNEEDRLELAENLWEELGYADKNATTHALLYRNMLSSRGLNPNEFPIHASTQRLIDLMMQMCLSPNPLKGLGALCLGAEAIVPHIYSQITLGFEAHNVSKEELNFFYLHIEEDDAHAATMKKLIDNFLTCNKEGKTIIRESAQKAIEYRRSFFESISCKASQLNSILIPNRGEPYAIHV